MEASETNSSIKLNSRVSSNAGIKKKILFACVAGDGHFNPLTPFATDLMQKGYEVRWYVSPYYRAKVESLGIQFYHPKRAFDIGGKVAEELFPERNAIKGKVNRLVHDLTAVFIKRIPEYFEDIREIHEEYKFDAVVVDNMFFAIPLIKAKLHVPVITIGVLPLTESSRDIAPPGLGLTPAKNIFQKLQYKILSRLIKYFFRKPTSLTGDIMKSYGLKTPVTNLFDYMVRESNIFLQLGTPGFEYPRTDLGTNIRFIGAALPANVNKKPWFHPKLERYKKAILVTQGTVETDVTKLLIPTIEAFKNSEYLVIVTTGGSQTAELRKKYSYPNVIIEDFIPFDEIMPMVNVYVSNGGYGGVTYSIKNKLPMVVAGIHEGKSEINARVGYFNIGINLNTERPEPKRIKSAVEKIITNGIYLQSIKKLSNEYSQYDSRELFVNHLEQQLEKHQQAN